MTQASTPTLLTAVTPRRRFLRTAGVVAGGLAIGVGATGGAAARKGQPSFAPEIYADGDPWGTKFTTPLPEPTNNEHAFDPLVFIVASDRQAPPLQLPIGESAPGNPEYNGGRWVCKTVSVTGSYDPTSPLTSYDDFLAAQAAGTFSAFQDGAPLLPSGDPVRPEYFQCPLLPVKD